MPYPVLTPRSLPTLFPLLGVPFRLDYLAKSSSCQGEWEVPSHGKFVPGILSQSSCPELEGSVLWKEPPLQIFPKAGSQSEFWGAKGAAPEP